MLIVTRPKEISKLARSGKFDYILIESSGISEPLPVAMTFSFEDETGTALNDIAKLDTMVTVIDAKHFWKDFATEEELRDRKMGVTDEDDRTIVDLLIDQVEFANVIILNKQDLVNKKELEKLKAVIHSLNPEAKVIESTYGKVPLSAILHTGLFDLEKSSQSAGWLKELQGEHVPETEEYGIASFVYRSRKPFHPERLYTFLQSETLGGVLRSKGWFWIASRPEFLVSWAQAGKITSITPQAYWHSQYDLSNTLQIDPKMKPVFAKEWHDTFFERKNEIVFIGCEMDQKALTKELDAALLTDEELALPVMAWSGFSDPFPAWV